MIEFSERLKQTEEYYFSKKLKEVRGLIKSGKPVINLGIGSPDLLPNPSVTKALIGAMDYPNAHQYQSYAGLPELREALVGFYHKEFKVSLNSETEVLPLMGSKEGIMHISMAFLNKGDEVLIPNPGYPTYESVTKLVEAKPKFYDLNASTNWFPDIKSLEKEDLSKVKIMWINYPNMPTGEKATKAQLEELVNFAFKNDILLVNDNPYSFILNDDKQSLLSIKNADKCCVELTSLSKTFNMSGWRIGFALGNPSFIKAILQVKSNMDSGMFFGIQKGATEALNMSNNWLESLNQVYKERRKLVWQIADKLKCTYNKQAAGLFVWAKLPANNKSEEFTDELLYNKSVFITPGTVFGTNGEGYIRLSLCANENDLQEILNRL